MPPHDTEIVMNKSDILWLLSGAVILALYLYGLYLTRKPKRRRRP